MKRYFALPYLNTIIIIFAGVCDSVAVELRE